MAQPVPQQPRTLAGAAGMLSHPATRTMATRSVADLNMVPVLLSATEKERRVDRAPRQRVIEVVDERKRHGLAGRGKLHDAQIGEVANLDGELDPLVLE